MRLTKLMSWCLEIRHRYVLYEYSNQKLQISRSIMDTYYPNMKKRKAKTSKFVAKPALKRLAKAIEVNEQQDQIDRPDVSDNCQESRSGTILKQLQSFKFRGFEVTNCIFKKKEVEICYILDDSMSIDDEDLKQRLISHLGVEGDTLKLTQLRERPVYQETSIQPGDRVNIGTTQCCVGAFVKVQDKGIHVLMSGHGKQTGDVLRLQNGKRVGKVVVSLTPQQRISSNEETVFRDISLGHLDCQAGFKSTVTTNDGISLQLKEDPEEAEDDMDVRLFINGDRRGKIESTCYIKMDQSLNINHRFISVKNEQGEPVHCEGESGLLIVKEPETLHNGGVEENKVTAVGMLISRETMNRVNADVESTSLAVPLTTGFKALSNDDYCGGADVKFC